MTEMRLKVVPQEIICEKWHICPEKFHIFPKTMTQTFNNGLTHLISQRQGGMNFYVQAGW